MRQSPALVFSAASESTPTLRDADAREEAMIGRTRRVGGSLGHREAQCCCSDLPCTLFSRFALRTTQKSRIWVPWSILLRTFLCFQGLRRFSSNLSGEARHQSFTLGALTSLEY